MVDLAILGASRQRARDLLPHLGLFLQSVAMQLGVALPL
jgi:hypothetical protein